MWPTLLEFRAGWAVLQQTEINFVEQPTCFLGRILGQPDLGSLAVTGLSEKSRT